MILKKFIAFILSAILLLSVPAFGTIEMRGAAAAAAEVDSMEYTPVGISDIITTGTEDSVPVVPAFSGVEPADDELVKIIVVLENEAQTDTNDKFKETEGVEQLREALVDEQNALAAKIASDINDGKPVEIGYNFTVAVNAFSAKVQYGKLDAIRALQGVKNAFIDEQWSLVAPCDAMEGGAEGFTGGASQASTLLDGRGMTIGVIDTGIDTDNNAFSVMPDTAKFNKETVAKLLAENELNAESSAPFSIGVNDVYLNSKLPFMFDYAEEDTDVNHVNENGAVSDHGTAVASVAAGLDSDAFRGAAPLAQIIVLKVFGVDGNGRQFGAYTSDILAALEDAITMGLDVVNMSLGSTSGFTSYGETKKLIESAMKKASQCGVMVVCAAGNEYSSALGNTTGISKNYLINPDNGTVNYPSTFPDALSVASADSLSESKENDSLAAESMSDFSSWGTTSDLKIKPEITAIGGSVLAAADPDISNKQYDVASGTSIATPYTAGALLLLKQHYNGIFPSMTAEELHDFCIAQMMSTATLMRDKDGNYYSPRKQGAGLVNVDSAINSEMLFSVEGCDRPKLELGDDPQKTGEYKLELSAQNISGTEQEFKLEAIVLTESIYDDKYIAEQAYDITEHVEVSSELTDGKIVFGKDESKKISVTLQLDAEICEYLETFPSGIYIDGFIRLVPTDEQDENAYSLPFLAFYGDYDTAPMFEKANYTDMLTEENPQISTQYPNMPALTRKDAPSKVYYLGNNPIWGKQAPYSELRNAISPNGDGYYDSISEVYLNLMRNARRVRLSISDTATGEVYYSSESEYETKSALNSSTGSIHPKLLIAAGGKGAWNGTDAEGATLGNGTSCTAYISAELAMDGYNSNNSLNCEWSFPITIDTEAPELKNAKLTQDGLCITAADGMFVADVSIKTTNDFDAVDSAYCAETEAGSASTVLLDIGDNSRVYAIVTDYALNQNAYLLSLCSGIKINEGDSTVREDETLQLSASLVGNAGFGTIDEDIVWESSVETVAEVDVNGKVIPIAAGQTTITAASAVSGKTASVNVTVSEISDVQAPDLAIDYVRETLDTTAGMEYRVGADGEWHDCANNMSIPEEWFGKTVCFRYKAGENEAASKICAIVIPNRPQAPASMTATPKSKRIKVSYDRSLRKKCEFSLDGISWVTGRSSSVTFRKLSSDTTYTIKMRYLAVKGIAFASETLESAPVKPLRSFWEIIFGK